MNKKGILPEKTVYFIIFIFLFMIAFLYATSFLKTSKAEFNSEEIEDSIIATRMINCLSTNDFGVIDETKMTDVELLNCFDGNYFFEIKLKKENDEKLLKNVFGDIGYRDYRTIKRYVNTANEKTILEINYKKNLKRYEDAD